MKDSKFIELLNLYVDHQISAADAVLLEAEIQKKPERRQVYRQYCQMQKACGMLADNFRTETPSSGKVLDFVPPRRRFVPVAYALGAVAAAVCVAFVMVNRTHLNQGLVATDHTSAPVVAVAVETPPAQADVPVLLPSRVPLHRAFDGSLRDATAVNFAAAETNRVPLDWIRTVQVQRVPADTLRFETRQSLEPQELMFRNSQRTFQGQAEMTAWRFMK